MPPRYFLRCLGSPELRGPTGEPIRIRTKKHFALLIYLAVEPRQHHRRDRLADLFWPNASLTEGRHSLATALSMIRGKLGPRSYEATRDTVKLATTELEVDLDRLLRGEVLGDEFTPPLEMSGFLQDFELTGAPEFMHWCDQRRAQLFPTIRAGFVTLMDRRRRTGAFALIEPLADRLLELDPLSEEAIRAKMEGRAFAGDRISAIRIYQDWKHKLSQELGAVPSELVEGMALRLRQRGYEPPGTSHIPTVPTDVWRGRIFVGREPEYQALYEAWERARGGRGGQVLVLGDSGIGKTTLIERFTTATALEGAVSARVQCYEVEREIPYATIGTLVRNLIELPGSAATSAEWLAELSKVVPAVHHRFANLPSPTAFEGEIARWRLAEAVYQVVQSVSEENPLVLLIDDLHLADDASIAVLHLLMRRTKAHSVLAVLAARQIELGQSPHASKILDSREALEIQAIDVPAFNDEETQLLISFLAEDSTEIPHAVRRALARSCSGVPMILELLFDDWLINREECLALSLGAMTAEVSLKSSVSLFNRVVDRMLLGLSDVARSCLHLAAVLGERLNDLPMYELVDLTLGQTLSGLGELSQKRILRDGGKELAFRNELLRARAYYSIPSSLRRAYHGLVADRLLLSSQRGEQIPGLTIAWHCFRSEKASLASTYLFRGAREAIQQGALFEAELALTSALKGLNPHDHFSAQVVLAEILQQQGRWKESLAPLKDLDASSPEDAEKLTLMRLLGESGSVTDQEGAYAALGRLRERSVDASASVKAVLLSACERIIYHIGDARAAADEARRAETLLPMLDALGDRVAAYTSYTVLSWLSATGPWQESLETLETLARECGAVGLFDSSVRKMHQVLGCALMADGQYQRAIGPHLEAFHLARMHGDVARGADSADNLSLCFGRLGDYQEQQAWASRALDVLAPVKDPWIRERSNLRIAFALCMRGENARAMSLIGSMQSDPALMERPWVAQASGLLRADILCLCGERQQALNLARQTLEATSLQELSRAYSGPLARWSANLSIEHNDDRYAFTLGALLGRITDQDRIDQAEILLANFSLRRAKGEDTTQVADEFSKRLAKLPKAVEEQLLRLQPMT